MSTASFSNLGSTTARHSSDFLTKEELRDRLNLPSTRKVEEMMKARMIPFMRLGHKTVRFNWTKVQHALNCYECKAVE